MIAALLLMLVVPAHAGPARGPWLVDVTSTTAKFCWRPADGATHCRSVGGLRPATTFTYTVPVSTLAFSARTMPPPGGPLRFAVLGDGGKATRAQFEVARLIEKLDPDLVLYTGDLVYPRGEDSDYDEKWFEPYGRSLARLVFYPALGNHDYGNYRSAARGQAIYENVYRAIHHRPKYYAFSAGAARFYALDDNEAYRIAAAASLAEDGDQRRWLASELGRGEAPDGPTWRFAFLHVPLYATRGHGDNDLARRSLEPALRRGGVHAVFAGHDHIYQRSKPVHGITHVTVGTGGGGLNFGGTKADWLAAEHERYGVLLVTLDSKTATGKFFAVDGSVLDEFTLRRP